MRFRLSPRGRRLAGVSTALLVVVGVSACDYLQDEVPQTITMVGSDTTQDVMENLAAGYNADTAYNTDPDKLVNIFAQQTTAETAPADAECGAVTYRTPAGAGQVLAPNGSSNGRNALRASVQNGDGCIDVARSSSPPRAIDPVSGDLSSFEYYAFGLDAVGWSSASTRAPAALSLAQLKGIYSCSYTNWNQVGGTAGPIERYWPQAGSGTRSFAQSDLLGFDPTTITAAGCPAVQLVQENSGTGVATNGDQLTAILPYSAGNYVAQFNGNAPDQRAGQTVRRLEGKSPWRDSATAGQIELNTIKPGALTAPVQEANVALIDPTPAYPGIRYVFNVVDNTSPSYEGAKRYVAFENEANGLASPLCGGKKKDVLAPFGFGPLDTSEPTPGTNLAASTCRLFTP